MLNMCKGYILSFAIFKQTITSLLKVPKAISYYSATHQHLFLKNYVNKLFFNCQKFYTISFSLWLYISSPFSLRIFTYCNIFSPENLLLINLLFFYSINIVLKLKSNF